MDAAAGLFAQKGYQATTTKDIAEAVDIGESTLYGYFSSKKDVLQAILSHQAEMVDALLDHLAELKDQQSFVELVDRLMEMILSRTVYNRVLIAEAWTDDEVLRAYVISHWQPILDSLQNFISIRVADGTFRPVEPDLGARLIVACFIAAIMPVLRGVEPTPSAERRLSPGQDDRRDHFQWSVHSERLSGSMFQRILAIIQKEFSQTWRDRTTLGIMLTMPLLQLILFGYAINTNVNHIPTVVADQSLDQASRAYLDDMVNSGYFDITATTTRPGRRDPDHR